MELTDDLPQTFRLLGKTWAIRRKEFSDLHGRCVVDELAIEINPASPREHQQDTVLHETMHAIDEELGLKLNEHQVEVLATVLFAWLQENPHVSSWLLKGPSV